MGKTIGRKLVDVSQKARGRMALRYELEVIPYLCSEIPDGVTYCSFAWERGSKLFVTEAEPVNPNSHAVFWKQYLRQTATMYKDGPELRPKDFAFKVQSVKPAAKGVQEKRKTVGKVHINLAQFCSEALDAQPQEMLLHLKPAGKLKVSIKATWLKNVTIDADAMTEVTATYADSQYDDEEEEYGEEEQEQEEPEEDWGGRKGGRKGRKQRPEDEQDLSGFDPNTGEPLPRDGEGASTSGYGEEYDEDGNPIRKSRRKGRRSRHSRREGSIPEGDDGGQEGDYGDPGGAGDEDRGGRRKAASSKGDGSRPKLQVYQGAKGANGAAPTGPGGLQMDSGKQLHKSGWRDYLCCCLPRRGPAEDPLEGDSLIDKGRLSSSAPGGTGGGRSGR
ncbi:hypothetical protein HYH03_000766 [Edaphochlamys debaryana]|uniref:C2 NT-type domain-containing protein n=1 Tax=Edaphochlamys debaryana TaxID=47281 RepID=A0A835YE69_9CHLO|nr:hypothetical protein HYH03_000766 [Edaphochlamys debaryana]|eukprot:KAG2500941.1 hypothetical protein HYH03_000766 [Edaphochlamys debaryana]